MELRVLRYFLEAAREGNITHAAQRLHISQPTLSKQLKELEGELGKKLFIRGNYNVRLTDEGMLLRKRAEDILDMVGKTEEEFKALGGNHRRRCPHRLRGIRWDEISCPTGSRSYRISIRLFDSICIAGILTPF